MLVFSEEWPLCGADVLEDSVHLLMLCLISYGDHGVAAAGLPSLFHHLPDIQLLHLHKKKSLSVRMKRNLSRHLPLLSFTPSSPDSRAWDGRDTKQLCPSGLVQSGQHVQIHKQPWHNHLKEKTSSRESFPPSRATGMGRQAGGCPKTTIVSLWCRYPRLEEVTRSESCAGRHGTSLPNM